MKCQTCPEELEQLSSGTWISSAGNVYCQNTYTGRTRRQPPILHRPVLSEDWIKAIRALQTNPHIWTPAKIGYVMGLAEDQVKEVLNARTTSQ